MSALIRSCSESAASFVDSFYLSVGYHELKGVWLVDDVHPEHSRTLEVRMIIQVTSY